MDTCGKCGGRLRTEWSELDNRFDKAELKERHVCDDCGAVFAWAWVFEEWASGYHNGGYYPEECPFCHSELVQGDIAVLDALTGLRREKCRCAACGKELRMEWKEKIRMQLSVMVENGTN